MYVLHYAADNASLIVRLTLEEAGLPYRTALVDRTARAQDGAAYRALNPAGQIPVLETPDGPIFETGAILLWLADRHPDAGLAPPPSAPARGAFLKWLFFLSNTAHADLRHLFYPDDYVAEEGRVGHRARIIARMQAHFALLDAAATAAHDLFAPPSVLGLYVATLLRWSVLYPKDQTAWCNLADTPALAALARRLEGRDAVARAARAEGLGARPFTDPTAPVPT